MIKDWECGDEAYGEDRARSTFAGSQLYAPLGAGDSTSTGNGSIFFPFSILLYVLA